MKSKVSYFVEYKASNVYMQSIVDVQITIKYAVCFETRRSMKINIKLVNVEIVVVNIRYEIIRILAKLK